METTPNEKKLQDELKDAAHKIWLAGLGALAAAEEQGNKVFTNLVERGRDVEAKGKVEVDKVKSRAGEVRTKAEATVEGWGDKVDETLTSALHRLGVPTREEIQKLTRRVEELNAKIETLKPRTTPAKTEVPVETV